MEGVRGRDNEPVQRSFQPSQSFDFLIFGQNLSKLPTLVEVLARTLDSRYISEFHMKLAISKSVFWPREPAKVFLLLLFPFAFLDALRGADQPPELLSARETYKKELEFASRPIRDRYLAALDALKRRLGKNGDLNAALAVEQEIESVRESASEAAGIEQFAGIWRIQYSNNTIRRYVINLSGNVTFSEENGKPIPLKKGKISLRDSVFFLDLGDGQIETLQRVGSSLHTEIYQYKARYPADPPIYHGISMDNAKAR